MNWVVPIRDEETLEKFKACLKQVDEKYFIMFEIGVGTGMQLQDILKLKNKDVRDKDSIEVSIGKNRQITFHYLEWTVKKELRMKRDGKLYKVSPWSLTWDDENYYLVAYDTDAEKIKHYRVDKMTDIELAADKRLGKEQFRNFDLAVFAKKTFGMYGGADRKVTLRCDNRLAGVILDRFGKDIMIIPKDDGTFRVSVLVSVSPQFFGWITALGPGVRIDDPSDVRDEYLTFLKHAMGLYEEEI